jgi:hypothetical protein
MEGLSVANLDNQLAIAGRVLPNDKPVFQAVGILMKRTEYAGVTLLDYSLIPGTVASEGAKKVPEEELPGQLSNVPVNFSVQGPFDKVYGMLTALDVTAPLSRVTSLKISGFSPDISQAATAVVGAQLGASVYYAAPPKDIGKASDPLRELTAQELATLLKIETFEAAGFDITPAPPGFDESKPNVFTF